SDKSVFASDEAREILQLLEAVADPGRDSLLKTALATSIVGLCAAEIVALDADETERQRWLEVFLGYRTLWENACFIALFRRVVVDQKVREKIVKRPGGERRLTNFLHLSELLHCAETDARLTPDALCAWIRK